MPDLKMVGEANVINSMICISKANIGNMSVMYTEMFYNLI